jgi:hypothetical protein
MEALSDTRAKLTIGQAQPDVIEVELRQAGDNIPYKTCLRNEKAALPLLAKEAPLSAPRRVDFSEAPNSVLEIPATRKAGGIGRLGLPFQFHKKKKAAKKRGGG